MKTQKTIGSVFVCILLLGFTMPATSANDGPFDPNAPKSLNDFAFWVGEWKFINSTPSGNQFKDAPGYNRISVTFDGYGILEDFGLGEGENEYRGGSLTVANPQTGVIQQTYIDNSGWTRLFEGGWENNQMVLIGPEETAKNGKKFTTRLVWKNIKDDSMDWSYERSVDGGKTWSTIWDIHYIRVK